MDLGRPDSTRSIAGLFRAYPAALVDRERCLDFTFDFGKLEVVANALSDFRFRLHAKALHERFVLMQSLDDRVPVEWRFTRHLSGRELYVWRRDIDRRLVA